MHYTSDPNEFLQEQQRRMQQPVPHDRMGDAIPGLVIGLIGWCYCYVRPVFLVYLSPFLLGGLTGIARVVGKSWYESLPPRTLSLTPFTEEHVWKALGNSLGLGFLWLLVIGGVIGAIAAVAYGLYIANWVTRAVSAYYVFSGARALYYWLYDVHTDQPFGTIFLVCFLVAVASEGVHELWRAGRGED